MAGEPRVSFSQRDAGRIAKATLAYEGGNRNIPPIRFRQSGDDGGTSIRLGQFTGAWSNEPPYNVKTVQLYKKHPSSDSPNAFVPDDSIVVAINLFSYIPTPRGGPTALWAAVIPIASGSFTYDVPGVHTVDGVEVQNTATTDTLYLLLAAEC